MCKSEAMMWSSGHCLRHIQSVQHQRSFHSSRFGGLLPEEIQYARIFSKQRKPNQLNSNMWLPNDEVCIMWCIVTHSWLKVDISLWMSLGKMLRFTKTLTSNRQTFWLPYIKRYTDIILKNIILKKYIIKINILQTFTHHINILYSTFSTLFFFHMFHHFHTSLTSLLVGWTLRGQTSMSA